MKQGLAFIDIFDTHNVDLVMLLAIMVCNNTFLEIAILLYVKKIQEVSESGTLISFFSNSHIFFCQEVISKFSS